MKKFLISFVTVLMLVVSCFSLTACEDIKKMEIVFDVYQGAEQQKVQQTVTVDLYRHLAPKTVDHIIETVNGNYYNGTLVYKADGYDSQIMVGDYLYSATDANKFTENTREKKYVDGEFEKGGTTGSDLINDKYSVGLWRTFDANNTSYSGSNVNLPNGLTSVYNSGSTSLYMPTSSIGAYNGYFCVFGKISTDESKKAFDKVVTAVELSEYYTEYTVFWTGTDPQNLQKHITKTIEYDDGVADGRYTVFNPEDNQTYKRDYFMYKPYKIKMLSENRRVEIASITIK